jgi:Zn-dependent protease
MFQSPPPTRYDLRFTLFGIPVRVHPLFWVIAALLGSTSNDIVKIITWIVAVFISVLIHELGHALVMRYYGISSNIILHFSGGLTVPESMRWGSGVASIALTPSQEILISLAGPFSGFAFAVFIIASVTLSGGSILMGRLLGVIPLPAAADLPFGGAILTSFVMSLLWVNIFWGIFNLMPVYPLDGGNVTRYALLKSDPWGGVRKSLWVSVVAGGVIALVGLIMFRSMYMAFLFAFLAFQSYQSLRGGVGGGY